MVYEQVRVFGHEESVCAAREHVPGRNVCTWSVQPHTTAAKVVGRGLLPPLKKVPLSPSDLSTEPSERGLLPPAPVILPSVPASWCYSDLDHRKSETNDGPLRDPSGSSTTGRSRYRTTRFPRSVPLHTISITKQIPSADSPRRLSFSFCFMFFVDDEHP